MKLCVLVGVFGLRMPIGERVAERQGTLNQFVQQQPVPRSLGWGNFTSPRGTVEFTLKKSITVTQDRFDRVVETMKVASVLIENVLHFTTPIKIQVIHYICPGDEKVYCPSRYTLGSAAPNNLRYYKGSKLGLMPQSLYRQDPNYKLYHVDDFYDFDVELAINAEEDFLFPRDYGKFPDKIDLLTTAVHEIFHALGIASNLAMIYGKQITPQAHSKRDHPYGNDYDVFLSSLFDTHLFVNGTDEPIDNIIQALDDEFQAKRREIWKESGEISLNNSLACETKSAKRLTELGSTEDSLYFKTSRGNKIKLKTFPGQYYSGSSISHTSSDYSRSINFLMNYSITNAIIFLDIIQDNPQWNTSPIGPLIVELLETLGYNLNPKPQWKDSQAAIYEDIKKINLGNV